MAPNQIPGYGTMPNISIKNVPEEVLEQLRQRARHNHRSLQGELMALICDAVANRHGGSPAKRVQPRGGKAIDEIVSEQNRRWKQPFREAPLAVDIIRSERDSR